MKTDLNSTRKFSDPNPLRKVDNDDGDLFLWCALVVIGQIYKIIKIIKKEIKKKQGKKHIYKIIRQKGKRCTLYWYFIAIRNWLIFDYKISSYFKLIHFFCFLRNNSLSILLEFS